MRFKVEIFAVPRYKNMIDLDDGCGFRAIICSMDSPYIQVNIGTEKSELDIIARLPSAIFILKEETVKRKGDFPMAGMVHIDF